MRQIWRAGRALMALGWGVVGWGCSAPTPQVDPGAEPPVTSPGAPRPIQPLIPAPSSPYSPPARNNDLGDDQLIKTTVAGDPTVIVYPRPTLESGRRYPVLIFMHGYGMDETQMTARTDLASAAIKEGWIAAAGDFGGKSPWANDRALQAVGNLVAELVEHHQADPQRIYFVGFSMGGGTALLAAANPLKLPYRVAAVVSTQGFTNLMAMTTDEAGGGVYADSIRQAYGNKLDAATAEAHSPVSQAEALLGLPVYLEHGESDTSVRATHTKNMAARLQALGASPEVHFYPGKGHSEETIDVGAIINFLRGKSAPSSGEW